MLLIFGAGCFFEPFAGSPEGAHSTTTFLRRMATDLALAGRFRSPRATARSVLPAANSAMLSLAPSVVIGDSRTELPSRAKVCASDLDQFLVVASGRADGDPQGDRTQDVIERAGGHAEQENAGSKDQERIVPSLPPAGASAPDLRLVFDIVLSLTRKTVETREKLPYISMTSHA